MFHDSQSEGLTFNNDITVKYGDKVVSSDSYTVDTTGLNEGETFRVTINDVKTVKDTDGQPIAVTAGGKFTVAYSSTLNEKSIIGAQQPEQGLAGILQQPERGWRRRNR